MIYQYQVSELLNNIKLTLSENFALVYVVGEIYEITKNSKSGHVYFSLKDSNASLNCVCWKNTAALYNLLQFDGQKVKIKAKIITFNNAKIYLDVITISLQEQGELSAKVEKLKALFTTNGVFAKQKQFTITKYPSVIGIITSATGAVIQDIIVTLQNKIAVKIIIYNANVQGEDSFSQVIAGIKYFNAKNNVNFIIIARGGGSESDLSTFNNEELVIQISQSNLPILTAIGHQTNLTLADLASACHYPTPTASVAWLPNKIDQINNVAKLTNDLTYKLTNLLNNFNNKITLTTFALANKATLLEQTNQKILFIHKLLKQNFQFFLKNYINKYNSAKQNLVLPDVNIYSKKLFFCKNRVNNVVTNINNKQKELLNLDKFIEATSFKNILKKGFTVIYKDNKVINNKPLSNGLYTIETFNHKQTVTITTNNDKN